VEGSKAVASKNKKKFLFTFWWVKQTMTELEKRNYLE
jgi:hypothetical protein